MSYDLIYGFGSEITFTATLYVGQWGFNSVYRLFFYSDLDRNFYLCAIKFAEIWLSINIIKTTLISQSKSTICVTTTWFTILMAKSSSVSSQLSLMHVSMTHKHLPILLLSNPLSYFIMNPLVDVLLLSNLKRLIIPFYSRHYKTTNECENFLCRSDANYFTLSTLSSAFYLFLLWMQKREEKERSKLSDAT
jgi:hypothetical protein